jgi:urease accessory protein UreH
MAKKTTCIEVRTAEGKHIFSLYLYEKEVAQDASQGSRNAQAGSNSNNTAPMTDAQKRYLFRILAEQGLEGDKAHQHLKEQFGVDSLQDVSKFEASRMIESLLEKAESR